MMKISEGTLKKKAKKIVTRSGLPRFARFIAGSGSLKDYGRNEPCPCGSGRKFKKCHGR